MNKSQTKYIEDTYKEYYELKDGKLIMKDGTEYKDVLCVGCSNGKYLFLCSQIEVLEINPFDIDRFKYTLEIEKERI